MINVILYRPEIPQNTGNIIRTCMATNTRLIIIGPLPFDMNDKALKRSGMDYIKNANVKIYDSYKDFQNDFNDKKIIYVTRYASKAHSDFDYSLLKDDINIMFGRESTGIPHDILRNNLEYTVRIPMVENARSLNLSNCVAVVLFEVMRQFDFPCLCKHETIKGENFLEEEKQKCD